MIELYKYGPVGDVCDGSPFCVKVEAYLRMANLPYKAHCGPQHLRKAPKRKLPYIIDNGSVIADSSFIIAYLNKTYGVQIDAHLNDLERATAHALGRMIDENLYWVMVHSRWTLPENLAVLNEVFFSGLPFPLNRLIAVMARKSVLKNLDGHGMGRHADAEVVEIGNRDLKALSDFLGSKDYFFGDQPCSLDATAYGTLVQMIRVSAFSAPIFDKAKSYKNLVDFTGRFHTRYFPVDT